MGYSRILKAEWIRLRRQPFLWIGLTAILYLAWNRWWNAYSLSVGRPGFSLSHISGALYSTPYWLGYAFWQLPIDTLSSILCLSAIGALWGMNDLNEPMVVEHSVRYRLFPVRLLLQRLGSLLLFCVLLQVAYGLLSIILQIVIHGSLLPDIGRAFPQIIITALYDFTFCFGGLVFTYLWRQVAGGILTVVALWWVWSNVVGLSIQNWFQSLPHWLCYIIMAIFPEPNLYVIRYSTSLWEQRLGDSGAFLPGPTVSGTPLAGIPYGVNYSTGRFTLYLPSNEVAIMTMLLEGILLFFVASGALRIWTSNVILQQNRTGSKVLPLRRTILLTGASAMAGVFLWIYVIAPMLANNSSRQLMVEAEKISALTKSNTRINNRDAAIQTDIGSVTVGDVYLETIFSYSPSYVTDQAILNGKTSDATVAASLANGYRALLDYSEECAGFARIHPQAWNQIVSNARAKPSLEKGPTLNFHSALVRSFQLHGIYPPRMSALVQGVDTWISNRLQKQFPGTTTQVVNQRDHAFEQQLNQLTQQGTRLVHPISITKLQRAMNP